MRKLTNSGGWKKTKVCFNLESILGKEISSDCFLQLFLTNILCRNCADKNETLVRKLHGVRESLQSSRKAAYDALMPREFKSETWSFMREINRTITNTMASQFSPNKRSKVYGASSKVRLLPAPVGAYTKTSLPTDMLQLFSFDSHAIQNSLWPQEQLSSLSQSTPCWNLNRKSRFNALSTYSIRL